MSSTPTTIAELFGSLGLTLTVRAAEDEDDAWTCTLTRPDGETYEIESVTFFDEDPETGEESVEEPTPTRVLSVLASGAVEIEDDAEADVAAAMAEAEADARAFLGDEAYELLLALDEAEVEAE